VDLLAKLDTGAAHCIFERKYGEMLGLAVESVDFNVFEQLLDRSPHTNTRLPFKRWALSFRQWSSSPKILHSAETFSAAPVGWIAFASSL